MANKLYNETSVENIADAIRAKNGLSDTYTIGEMAQAILDIPSGSSTLGTKSISENGTYNASSDNLDGYSQVTVSVSPTLQNKSVTENGTYTADQGYDGLGTVTVSVSGGGSPFPSNFHYGKVTLDGSEESVTIPHGCNSTPVIAMVALDNYSNLGTNKSLGAYWAGNASGTIINFQGVISTANNYTMLSADATNLTLIPRNSSYPFPAGDYYWIAIE